MLSSKPVASTWLDRLRVNRGLSTAEDEDAFGNPRSLDDFLRRNHHTEIPAGNPATSSASDSPPPAPIPSDPEFAESPSEPASGELYGAMSDILSKLFGGSSTTVGKKLPRKQSNPRHCSDETPAEFPLPRNQLIDRECLPGAREFAWVNSHNEKPAPETRERRRTVAEADGVEDEEEEGEKDLVGFSRSEVTVIDTSFDVWKSEKLVFRRRNIWKVRDNKGKSRIASSKKKIMKMKKKKTKTKKNKKRKCDDDDDDDEDAPRRKKMKMSTSTPDNNSPSHFEEVHDEPESSNTNRIPLRRLRSKPRKESSFGGHTSNKNSEPEARGHGSLP